MSTDLVTGYQWNPETGETEEVQCHRVRLRPISPGWFKPWSDVLSFATPEEADAVGLGRRIGNAYVVAIDLNVAEVRLSEKYDGSPIEALVPVGSISSPPRERARTRFEIIEDWVRGL